MINEKMKICAKGSRKTGEDFIKETLEIIKYASFLEINCNYPQFENFDKELDFLANIQKELGISYVVHAPYLNSSLGDINKNLRVEAVKEVFAAIDRAKFLESDLVTIHPSFDPYGIYFEEREKAELTSYKEISKYASDRNVRIGLENEAQTCFFFPDRACKFNLIKKIVDKINMDNFGYTIDLGHGNISGINLEKSIKQASSKLFHIHAHDNFGGKEDLHLAPGNGNIDWNNILKALDNIKYNNLFEIETDLQGLIKGKEYLINL